MQQTPIEFFIEKLKALHESAYDTDEAIKSLSKEATGYEKQYLRDVAEKSINYVSLIGICETVNKTEYEEHKQTYLNQNHPL